jgi:HAD superfamily hydrolase (TIGR01509 family)
VDPPVADIAAVCFDFYNTLATHRHGVGRGRRLMQYLEANGLECDAWEHQVLYDVFEPHGREYSPAHSPELKHAYYCRLAGRVFERLNVRAPRSAAADHASHVWEILGPASLVLFPEVPGVLRSVKRAGLLTAIVSNWMCGLEHFCVELGIGSELDHVIASAEVGAAKPDPVIFEEASRRLGVPPERILHIGDTFVDDVEGARAAGFQAILVQRSSVVEETHGPAVSSLDKVLNLPGIARRKPAGDGLRRT